MILYNITQVVSDEKAQQYIDWLQITYLPLLRNSTYFHDVKLFKIIDSPNEGQSFSLQLFTPSIENIDSFKTSLLNILYEKMQHDFNGHLLIFDTVMQYIDNKL